MSYDIRVCAKVEGCNKYVNVGYPEYDTPTYNLGDMFVACMDWDFDQMEHYPAAFALDRIEHGIHELVFNRSKYEKYNPENGWGNLDLALRALQDARTAIFECAEEYPIGCLYLRW